MVSPKDAHSPVQLITPEPNVPIEAARLLSKAAS